MNQKLLPENKEPVAEVENVTFSYNKEPVLENISLKVLPGDFLALIGPNGAAKSTLLKLIVGILRPKAGAVRLFGQDVRLFRDWGRIGYVSQYAAQFNTAFPTTVQELVASGYYEGFGRFLSFSKTKDAVYQAMEAVGIKDLFNKLMGELSGGQRQKVFLAKALVKRPELLFLDEPTTGIDAASQSEFYELLSHLNKKGITIVIVTHDIGAAFDKAGKIGCVRDKKVYVHENTEEVTQEHIAEVLGYKISFGAFAGRD